MTRPRSSVSWTAEAAVAGGAHAATAGAQGSTGDSGPHSELSSLPSAPEEAARNDPLRLLHAYSLLVWTTIPSD